MREGIRILVIMIAAACCAAAFAIKPSEGLVRISVGTLREQPAQSAELATQALMGTPLTIHSRDGEWLEVSMPDGYRAWINESGVHVADSAEMNRWRSAHRMIVTMPQQIYVVSDTILPGPTCRISDLVTGNIVENISPYTAGEWINIKLPDGRIGFANRIAFSPLEDIAARTPQPSRVVEFAKALIGTPYLWGGTSIKMIDCSGLVSLAYFMEGLILPRNTSAQARIGEKAENPKEGDILVFSNPATGKVNHVGIYMADSMFIHASGQVKVNSLDPQSPDFSGKLHTGTRHITGNAPEGVTRLIDHNGYFNK